MANQKHLDKLNQGVDTWNRWVKKGAERADLRDADLSGLNLTGYDFTDAHLKGAKLKKANLRNSKLNNAYLRRANLTGADLTRASLPAANLRHAVLRDALLTNAYLRRVDLSYVDLSGADLTGAVLEYARFVDVNLERAILKNCFIYGASVWNIIGRPREQSNLVITPSRRNRDDGPPGRDSNRDDPVIAVDDIEVAQFIYLLLNYKKFRGAINSVTEKGVLLLGRFGEGGLSVLQAVGKKLSENGYLPIVFDFDRPNDRDYTETVRILAGLSRFVIVDLSGPSVPLELGAVVPHIKIPYVAIMEKGRKPFSMFSDLLQYPWVVRPIVTFASTDELLELLPARILAPAEEKYRERRKQLEEVFGRTEDGQIGPIEKRLGF